MSKLPRRPLDDLEWARIDPILPKLRRQGRPQNTDRDCLDALLWVRQMGKPWNALPRELGVGQTVWTMRNKWRYFRVCGRIVLATCTLRGISLE